MKTKEAAKALTDNAYTRTDYDFAGWNTVAAPTEQIPGTAYTDVQSVQNLTTEANGNVTLYAQWTQNNFNITIDSVAVSDITAPVATETLDTAATTDTANVTLKDSGAIIWSPAAPLDGKAVYGTTYTATLTAIAAENYAFADTATATVNGQTAIITRNQDATLSISCTFEKTAKYKHGNVSLCFEEKIGNECSIDLSDYLVPGLDLDHVSIYTVSTDHLSIFFDTAPSLDTSGKLIF